MFGPWRTLTVKKIVSPNSVSLSNGSDSITLSDIIDNNVPQFKDKQQSKLHPLLINGHFQTCFADINEFNDIHNAFYYNRFIVNYPDGGQGALDVVKRRPPLDTSYIPKSQTNFNLPTELNYSYTKPNHVQISDDSKHMLIIIHGLTGGSRESYIRSVVHTLLPTDFEIAILNSRGCCNSTLTTPLVYNGGTTNDIRYTIKFLRYLFPNRHFYLLGFSLGGSMISNYIGEQSYDSDIVCGIAISNPWDLLKSSHFINNGIWGKYIYSPKLAQNLKNLLTSHNYIFNYPDSSYDNIRTLLQFDDFLTGPLFGYKDAHHYYTDASSKNRISSIRTPFFAIHSMDDPITGPLSDQIRQSFYKNPYTTLIETDIGGHVAWIMDNQNSRWFNLPLSQILLKFQSLINNNYKIVHQTALNNKIIPVMTSNLKLKNCTEKDFLNNLIYNDSDEDDDDYFSC